MRPTHSTPAHKTGGLAELVCSNTFKSLAAHSAHGIFKKELAQLGSLLMKIAPLAQVPAGEALAVDREVFSNEIERALLETGRVERCSALVENIDSLPLADRTIIATGPLTQGPMADYIRSLSNGHGLYFYDAIAPVIDATSIDTKIAFQASRYGKGTDDYWNCPMSREEYDRFYDALIASEKMAFHDFEAAQYFQGCQPIEAIAETGRDSLRFGPMKPVGLEDPRTQKRPHAVVQLRIDNLAKSAYNMVGFQTKMKYGEQIRVFRLIPGLENAEFLRLGSMHRNTYICTPELLKPDFSLNTHPNIHFAGQITGVEGYTESSAIGLLCALAIDCHRKEIPWTLPPKNTATGSLCRYLFESPAKDFQPVNVHFGLIDTSLFNMPGKKIGKNETRTMIGEQCLTNLANWKKSLPDPLNPV